jgi:hypothetical protein
VVVAEVADVVEGAADAAGIVVVGSAVAVDINDGTSVVCAAVVLGDEVDEEANVVDVVADATGVVCST